MLRSACPTVVTVHDLTQLKRRSEHLRTGLRQRLRHLAVQRAMRVVVPTRAVADDAVEQLGVERRRVVVIPHAADPAMRPRDEEEVASVRAALQASRALPGVGGRAAAPGPDQTRRRAGGHAAAPAAGDGRADPPVGARASRGDPHRHGLRRAPGGDLQRRPRARAVLRERGLRPARRGGARLRHAGQRLPRAGARRGARRAGHVRRAGRHALADRGGRSRHPSRPGPAAVELAGRRAGDLGGLRERARGRGRAARRRAPPRTGAPGRPGVEGV